VVASPVHAKDETVAAAGRDHEHGVLALLK
jgi:hypothetical protein